MDDSIKVRRLNALESGIVWPNDSEVTSMVGDGVNIQVYEANSTDITPMVTLLPTLTQMTSVAFNGGNSSTVTLQASSSMATNSSYSLTFPTAAGSANQVLSTSGSGVLTFSTPTTGTVTSVAVTGSTGLAVSGSPITSNGTIALTLGNELQALSALSSTGLVTRTGTATYAERTITIGSSNNLSVINGDGIGGNPTVDLIAKPVLNSITINNAPSASTDGVNKAYADALVSGIDFQSPCVVATTVPLTVTYLNGNVGVGATLTNNGTQAVLLIDGVNPIVGNRVLVKNQGSTFQNGIYTVTNVGSGSTNWILTRATDYNGSSPNGLINAGDLIPITSGTMNINTSWMEISTPVTVVGTDAITFTIFSYGPSSFLQVSNNLSDVANKYTAVTNIGLSTAVVASGSTSNAIPTFTTGTVINGGTFTTITPSTLTVANGGLVVPANAAQTALTGTTGIFAVTTTTGAPTFTSGTTATGAYTGTLAVINSATNGTVGTGVLASGVAVISTTAVKANSIIMAIPNGNGPTAASSAYTFAATQGSLRIGTITAGTSFTVNSSNLSDVSSFNWVIFNA